MPYQAPNLYDSFMKGVQGALTLEQLAEVRQQRKEKEDIRTARDTSFVTTQTPRSTNPDLPDLGIDTTTKFDPELYATKLDAISPEKANAFRQTQLSLETAKNQLDSANLDLELKVKAQPLKKDILNTEAVTRAWDYLKATKDIKGTIGLFNKYADKENQVQNLEMLPNGNVKVTQKDGDVQELNDEQMMMLGRNKEVQLQQWTELTKARESIKAATERKGGIKPKTPKKAGPTDIQQAGAYLASITEFEGMKPDQLNSLKVSIANGILDEQQKAVNKGEEPPSYEEARDTVVGNLMSRTLPPVKTAWWDKQLDKPARYFNSVNEVTAAFKAGEITPVERATILNNGFGQNEPILERAKSADGQPLVHKKTKVPLYLNPEGKYYYADGTAVKE